MPPTREVDHRIPLKEGSMIVRYKPYQYLTPQKEEMLASGIIRLSSSPFSYLVILVWKKNQSWRMCIDYRRLNHITIKDKFSIRLMDELLAELHGASVFSKIDLRSGYHQIQMDAADTYKNTFRAHGGTPSFS